MGEWSDKREEASKEGIDCILIFLWIIIYAVYSEQGSKILSPLLENKMPEIIQVPSKMQYTCNIRMKSLTIFIEYMHLLHHYKSTFSHLSYFYSSVI